MPDKNNKKKTEQVQSEQKLKIDLPKGETTSKIEGLFEFNIGKHKQNQ